MNIKLDKIDRAILKALQEDCSISNVALAEMVGITPPPCLRRVQKLEKHGYITGYHAEINPGLMGYGVTAFVHLLLSNKKAERRKLDKLIAARQSIRQCFELAGGLDLLLCVVARDAGDLEKIVADLGGSRLVVESEVMVALHATKSDPGIPIDC